MDMGSLRIYKGIIKNYYWALRENIQNYIDGCYLNPDIFSISTAEWIFLCRQ